MKSTYLVPLVASSLLLPGSAMAAETPAAQPAKAPAANPPPAASQAGLRGKLQKLAADQPQATGTVTRAICYAPPRPPDNLSYLCPECGEKTIYAIDAAAATKTLSRNRIVSVMRVTVLRRQAEQIRQLGLAVKLDEKAWCRKCQPTPPQDDGYDAGMVVTWPDGKTHRVDTITFADLDLLIAFLKGDSAMVDVAGQSTPLKDKLPRLQELLGIDLK